MLLLVRSLDFAEIMKLVVLVFAYSLPELRPFRAVGLDAEKFAKPAGVSQRGA